MMHTKRLALFDFCETLVDFQSIPPYLSLVASVNNGFNVRHSRLKQKLYKRLYKYTKLDRFNLVREAVSFPQLRDVKLDTARDIALQYTKHTLLKHINKRVIDRLELHRKEGYAIVIISGGLEIYIKEFAKLFDIPHVVAIELESVNGILTGRMQGIHTMQHRKLYKLSNMLDLSTYDLNNSYAYSDCPSDIPLLSFVGNGVAVKCNKDMQWASIMGYEVI